MNGVILPSRADLIEKIELLEARIKDLEAALGAEFHAPACFGLTPVQERLLGALISRDRLSRDAAYAVIYNDYAKEPPAPKVLDTFMCHVRKKLAPADIVFTTHFGLGWSMDADNKAKVQGFIDRGATA
jgi:hypothetical protein